MVKRHTVHAQKDLAAEPVAPRETSVAMLASTLFARVHIAEGHILGAAIRTAHVGLEGFPFAFDRLFLPGCRKRNYRPLHISVHIRCMETASFALEDGLVEAILY